MIRLARASPKPPPWRLSTLISPNPNPSANPPLPLSQTFPSSQRRPKGRRRIVAAGGGYLLGDLGARDSFLAEPRAISVRISWEYWHRAQDSDTDHIRSLSSSEELRALFAYSISDVERGRGQVAKKGNSWMPILDNEGIWVVLDRFFEIPILVFRVLVFSVAIFLY